MKHLGASDNKYSWRHQCSYRLGPEVPLRSWAIFTSQPFAVGCFICWLGKVNSPYARVQVQPKQVCDLANHGKNKKHLKALEELRSKGQGRNDPPDEIEVEVASDMKYGMCSGLSLQVPRMETWVACLNTVLTRASFLGGKDDASSASVSSGLLDPEKDMSNTVARKLLQCLRSPLDERDRWHMRNAVAASIGLDKGDSYLVLYARILSKAGIYDFLLGIDGDATPDTEQPDAARQVVEAIRRILVRASIVRGAGRRDKLYSSSDDTGDEQALKTFCDAVVSITADGGPVEQRAAYECSPKVAELVGCPGRLPLFRNCALITRDRAHRVRSIQKLFFKKLPPVFKDFINSLLLGKRSLCSLIQTSDKFQKAFIEKQKAFRHSPDQVESAEGFSKLIKSLSFADHRFDSRQKPLHRLFSLLGVVISLLTDIANGVGPWQSDDRSFALELLQQFSGDRGYNTVVSAALVADIMIIAQPFLRVADAGHADFSLSAASAAECLATLRHLLKDGAIWLPEAKETLVHRVLRAIQDKLIILEHGQRRSEAVAIRWPAPNTAARKKPIAVARELLVCILESFPAFRVANSNCPLGRVDEGCSEPSPEVLSDLRVLLPQPFSWLRGWGQNVRRKYEEPSEH